MDKDARQRYTDLLEVYTLEEILELNDMELWEVLEILVEDKYVTNLPREPL